MPEKKEAALSRSALRWFSTPKSPDQPLPKRFLILQLAFPYHDALPAESAQQSAAGSVTHQIPIQLSIPILGIALGPSAVAASLVAMPKTPMHTYGNLVTRQHDIGFPRQAPIVQAESETGRMQQRTNRQLRRSVDGMDATHNFAAPLTCESIHENRPNVKI